MADAICIIPIGAGGSTGHAIGHSVVLEGVRPASGNRQRAVFNTFRQVGGAVAIATFGALIAHADQIDQGLRLSLGISAAVLFLAALNSLRFRPRADTAA